jgi:hypothetical protein
MRRAAMIHAVGCELVAEIVLKPHKCGPDCLCRELRRVPAIDEEIRRLHLEKLRHGERDQRLAELGALIRGESAT